MAIGLSANFTFTTRLNSSGDGMRGDIGHIDEALKEALKESSTIFLLINSGEDHERGKHFLECLGPFRKIIKKETLPCGPDTLGVFLAELPRNNKETEKIIILSWSSPAFATLPPDSVTTVSGPTTRMSKENFDDHFTMPVDNSSDPGRMIGSGMNLDRWSELQRLRGCKAALFDGVIVLLSCKELVTSQAPKRSNFEQYQSMLTFVHEELGVQCPNYLIVHATSSRFPGFAFLKPENTSVFPGSLIGLDIILKLPQHATQKDDVEEQLSKQLEGFFAASTPTHALRCLELDWTPAPTESQASASINYSRNINIMDFSRALWKFWRDLKTAHACEGNPLTKLLLALRDPMTQENEATYIPFARDYRAGIYFIGTDCDSKANDHIIDENAQDLMGVLLGSSPWATWTKKHLSKREGEWNEHLRQIREEYYVTLFTCLFITFVLVFLLIPLVNFLFFDDFFLIASLFEAGRP